MKQKLEKKEDFKLNLGFNLNSHFASNEKKKKTHGNALLWNWDTPNERWPFKKKTTNG